MKIRRQHLIIAAIVLLGITFLVIGVFHKSTPKKYYAHSLRNWQESDSVAGYPIAINGNEDEETTEFLTTEFQPNLSTMSAMERFRLPTARGFQNFDKEPRAAGTGLVLFTGAPSGYDGKAVLLGHRLPDGTILQTFYSGLSKISVKVNQQVSRGSLLGEGSITLEVREGVGIDITQEEIDGLVLNSQNSHQAPNRLNLAEFFEKHRLVSPLPDPLSLIQANEIRETRKKLGLEE